MLWGENKPLLPPTSINQVNPWHVSHKMKPAQKWINHFLRSVSLWQYSLRYSGPSEEDPTPPSCSQLSKMPLRRDACRKNPSCDKLSGKRYYSSLGVFSSGFANSWAVEDWMNWTEKTLTFPQSIAIVSRPSEKCHTSNKFASWEMITIFCVSIKEILIIWFPECVLTFIFPEHTKRNNY